MNSGGGGNCAFQMSRRQLRGYTSGTYTLTCRHHTMIHLHNFLQHPHCHQLGTCSLDVCICSESATPYDRCISCIAARCAFKVRSLHLGNNRHQSSSTTCRVFLSPWFAYIGLHYLSRLLSRFLSARQYIRCIEAEHHVRPPWDTSQMEGR